ncbi:hypothetical protein [Microbacterium sp. NIBRBAC000506063]|nr:hypothetical protein [Microbacterium sp. NIBRBAC000506063]
MRATAPVTRLAVTTTVVFSVAARRTACSARSAKACAYSAG